MTPSEYQNPILCADYSDPDIVRVGDDFFMVSSSFNHVPALPILHSTDPLIGLSSTTLWMNCRYGYDRYQPGKGVWAPSIRWHDGKLWVCFSTPDEGIFICHTEDPWGMERSALPARGQRLDRSLPVLGRQWSGTVGTCLRP